MSPIQPAIIIKSSSEWCSTLLCLPLTLIVPSLVLSCLSEINYVNCLFYPKLKANLLFYIYLPSFSFKENIWFVRLLHCCPGINFCKCNANAKKRASAFESFAWNSFIHSLRGLLLLFIVGQSIADVGWRRDVQVKTNLNMNFNVLHMEQLLQNEKNIFG